MTASQAFGETWRLILTTKTLLSTMLLSVVLYAFYYPAPYAHQVAQELPIIVIDEDDSTLSRQLLRDLDSTRAISITGRAANFSEARAQMRQGGAEGVILVTDGLERRLRTGAPGSGIKIWLNAGYLLRASSVGDAVTAVLDHLATQTLNEAGQAARVGPPVEIIREALFNRTGGYEGYVFPAVAVIIAQQTLLFGAATLIGGRRRTGKWQMASAEYLGTWAAFTSVGGLSCAFLFGWIFWVQDIPRTENLVALAVSVPLLSTAVAGLGLWLGSYFDRAERAMVILGPTSAPFFFLSGAAWPLDQMPAMVRWIAYLIPSTAGVHLFVPLNQMDAALTDVLPSAGLLLALTLLYVALGWLRLVRRGEDR